MIYGRKKSNLMIVAYLNVNALCFAGYCKERKKERTSWFLVVFSFHKVKNQQMNENDL
jgi:hypothetical protein